MDRTGSASGLPVSGLLAEDHVRGVLLPPGGHFGNVWTILISFFFSGYYKNLQGCYWYLFS